ncbi:UNVERIFIED_CONTAM: Glucan endo-1,3-beta-glucosidase 11 [Sesamum radiatum]|uniref:Glucan endo-1,3-beta-glucosidase 11 n=1 Tax=Sesamum radiatum TaxID=300843 RepID=A0AAW2JWV8_SESRA
MAPSYCPIRVVAATFSILLAITTVNSIGVNYGTLGDNLPPPALVAQFLKEKTTIDRVKTFNVNPDILRAFAKTGIPVTVTIPNDEIPGLTDVHNARRWVSANIKPFYPRRRYNISWWETRSSTGVRKTSETILWPPCKQSTRLSN